MADASNRPSLLVIIPPPVWALAFLLMGWAAGAAIDLQPEFRSSLAGWILFATGFVIAASGRLAFAKAGAEVVPVSKKNSALVISGPFRFTRNPMYLGIVIAMTGLALQIGTAAALASVLAFFVFVNFISIPYEEEKMERQFGEDYRTYKNRVRRWI